ncbi:pyruvate kinase [Candidatus Peribacteria bacterium]|nr:pyruvate kinase [Candidatus Peribacteria bacterium]
MLVATAPRLRDVVCTLGPACESPEVLAAMAAAGMTVARLNVSHRDHASHRGMHARIQQLNATRELPVRCMLDTKGADIRCGEVSAPVVVQVGDSLILDCQTPQDYSQTGLLYVDYQGLVYDVALGTEILLDEGKIALRVEAINGARLQTVVVRGGRLSTKRHVHVPGVLLSLPSVTEQDWDDIAFGVELGCELYALSFVQSAEDIIAVREFLAGQGSDAQIIAKIETSSAVEGIEDILRVADGIMVARGDLRIAVGMAALPRVQWQLVAAARAAGKYCIVATEMLQSMVTEAVPTRAEATDVALAVWQGADAVMLSAESAVGQHPVLAVEALSALVEENAGWSLSL